MQPLHDLRPAAWSKAILVDADVSGVYDDFEFAKAIRELLKHKHEKASG